LAKSINISSLLDPIILFGIFARNLRGKKIARQEISFNQKDGH
jgi:hypothetical protein